MDTSLHVYARCGRVDATRMQLQHGADTEVRNAQGLTPLLLAARYNQLQVLQILIQHGARTDAFAPLANGVELGSCVHFAAESGHVQILKFLVTAAALDADERTCGVQELTALHLAAQLGRVDIVRFLVAHKGVDINACDAKGMTPLHHACDYSSSGSEGDTNSPLSDAAHVEAVEVLIHARAILDVRRATDLATPLWCARHRGHVLVAKTLTAHGAYSGISLWLYNIKSLLFTQSWTRKAAEETKTKTQQQPMKRSRSDSLCKTDLLDEKPNPL